MKKKNMLAIFGKLTSGKPEFREQPKYIVNSTVGQDPCWFKLYSPIHKSHYYILRNILRRSEHKDRLKSKMLNSPNERGIIYNYDNCVCSITYYFRQWLPLTERRIFNYNSIDVNRTPLLESLDGSKPGLGDVFKDSVRIKKFKLLDVLLYSYWRDIRFIIFFSLFLGFTIWIETAPEQLLNKPIALSSVDLKNLTLVLKDTYVNHVCSTHPDVISPCDCGEPLNKIVRDLFQDESFDPLHLESGKTRIKALSFMVGFILLTLILSESVSEHGVYTNLN